MNLQPRKETIVVQNEFLSNTQGLEFATGGITLDGASFGAGTVKAGTAVMIPSGNTLAVAYADNTGSVPAGAELHIVASDVIIESTENHVVGSVVRGHLKESALTNVTDAFKDYTRGRYFFE